MAESKRAPMLSKNDDDDYDHVDQSNHQPIRSNNPAYDECHNKPINQSDDLSDGRYDYQSQSTSQSLNQLDNPLSPELSALKLADGDSNPVVQSQYYTCQSVQSIYQSNQASIRLSILDLPHER